MKYSTFLCDTGTDLISAVVISEKTTPNDIERIVKDLRSRDCNFTWEDLWEALPEDCEVYHRSWCDNEVDV